MSAFGFSLHCCGVVQLRSRVWGVCLSECAWFVAPGSPVARTAVCARVWQGHRIQHLTAPSPPALPPFPDGIHQNIKYKEKMQRAAAHERKLQKRRDRKARELALFATWRGTGAGAGAEADAAIRS